jgi:hypothetical protein
VAESVRKWLVIDASIGGMTGGGGTVAADSPQGRCRRCLRAVQDNRYGIYFHPQTWEEWGRHRSEYSRQWLQGMYSRKRLRVKNEEEISASVLSVRLQKLIGKKIGYEILSEAVYTIMLKDCHLVEAALDADRVVISLDDRVRFHFKAVSEIVTEIGPIVWVNPDNTEEESVAWLEAGAEPEKHRQLGFRQDFP